MPYYYHISHISEINSMILVVIVWYNIMISSAGTTGETIKLSFQSHLQHQDDENKFLPPIAKW